VEQVNRRFSSDGKQSLDAAGVSLVYATTAVRQAHTHQDNLLVFALRYLVALALYWFDIVMDIVLVQTVLTAGANLGYGLLVVLVAHYVVLAQLVAWRCVEGNKRRRLLAAFLALLLAGLMPLVDTVTFVVNATQPMFKGGTRPTPQDRGRPGWTSDLTSGCCCSKPGRCWEWIWRRSPRQCCSRLLCLLWGTAPAWASTWMRPFTCCPASAPAADPALDRRRAVGCGTASQERLAQGQAIWPGGRPGTAGGVPSCRSRTP
jgi:hypothetical protein